MNIEKVHKGIRYTLSNDNLKEGDKVYPIARGRCLDNGGWILHGFDFRAFMCGFPDEPHTIIDLDYSTAKPQEVRTDMGYSPIEGYYKIVKREEQVKVRETMFGPYYTWTEIENTKQKEH